MQNQGFTYFLLVNFITTTQYKIVLYKHDLKVRNLHVEKFEQRMDPWILKFKSIFLIADQFMK